MDIERHHAFKPNKQENDLNVIDRRFNGVSFYHGDVLAKSATRKALGSVANRGNSQFVEPGMRIDHSQADGSGGVSRVGHGNLRSALV